ncbi:MAG: amino acid racemase [Bacteroidales bacterium]|nr:amino acid racemase [Bacteroidales bacterium]
MKKIGILGGMSWQSTVFYYRHINRMINERLGGLYSGECLVHSVDFQRVVDLQSNNDWKGLVRYLSTHLKSLETAGSAFAIMASNTVHLIHDELSKDIKIPLVHIVDAVGERLYLDGKGKVGVLGTSYTLKHGLYKDRLREYFRVGSLLPNGDQAGRLDEVIFGSLAHGRVTGEASSCVYSIANDLMQRGAGAIVLGCTELGMLQPFEQPAYDAALIHCQKAVDIALKGKDG